MRSPEFNLGITDVLYPSGRRPDGFQKKTTALIVFPDSGDRIAAKAFDELQDSVNVLLGYGWVSVYPGDESMAYPTGYEWPFAPR